MSWLRSMLGKPGSEGHDLQPDAARPGPSEAPSTPAVAWDRLSDKAAAMEWAGRLEDDASLAEAATQCRFAEIRLAAARRISDLAVLKQLANASRDKDKQVYRHCTDTLRAHRQSVEHTRRAAELALALRALLDARPVAVSRLLQIEKEFAALGDGAEHLSDCAALLARAQTCVLEETQAQIEMRACLVAAEALRSDVAGAEGPPGGRLEAWRERYTSVAQAAACAPAWLAKFPAGRGLASVLQDIESRLAALALDIERTAASEKVVDSAPPVEKPAPAPPKPPRRKVDHAAVQGSLDDLEKHLEDGRLADAEGVASRIEQAISGGALSGPSAQRLQRARAQLTRLRGWARWGTDQAREQLIAEAEALLRSAPDIDERARAVPALHKEWKRLDAHGPAAKALWARFDAALEKTYRPVLEQRAAEAVRHEAARAAKAACCEAWEAWIEQFSSTTPDYRALAAKRGEIAAQWRTGAMAGFRDERKLRKRLDALLKRMDGQLDEAQAKEIARREQLVAAAERLRDETEIGRAVSEARSLQARWKDELGIVRLRHGAEHKLWQRFRVACDAVFTRRDSLRTEQTAQRQQRQQAREVMRRSEQELETSRKTKHAARFALMAQKAALAEPVEAEALAQGHAARAELLIDLEIALELPTPEAHAHARRARALSRLQDRFRRSGAAPQQPEAMVAQWYAIAATPDEEQATRIAAIVRRLLERAD